MRTAFAAILSALVVTAALGITVSAADPNPCEPKPCLLRFANQPKTTVTDGTITDEFNSSGGAIRVEIYDAKTGVTVNWNAAVTLTLGFKPGGSTATLTGGGPVNAVAGVATFPALKIDVPGAYKLMASSPAASNTPLSGRFMVSDTVEECTGPGCSFTENQGFNSYTTTPKNGTAGADWATTLNLPGLRISCEFAPFNYSDLRQPNAVWYVYDDGGTSSKKNVIVIDKLIVQETPENGASKYRVCYTSPVRFRDRTGNWAQPDPWTNGPSAFFGETWYTGLLPDCGSKKNPELPCSLGFVGNSAGDRIGTFLTPPGDPSYR
ncbi:MAG TPA: hypothetical protein VFP66_03155 [Candidatus Limnocylindrales bacterium]|nr:hypothetical protein [Candidatus Limnocylindrales bacterium]